MMIAMFSDCTYQKKKKFVPLAVWLMINLLYLLALLICSFFMTVENSKYTAFVQGFIDNGTNFYFVFMASIMISYDHRHTQEITPTATIITVNFLFI